MTRTYSIPLFCGKTRIQGNHLCLVDIQGLKGFGAGDIEQLNLDSSKERKNRLLNLQGLKQIEPQRQKLLPKLLGLMNSLERRNTLKRRCKKYLTAILNYLNQ